MSTTTFQGSEGKISVRHWPNPDATHVVIIAHGYGEHIGRYDHVARRLAASGAVVWGPDHLGHGSSEGERVLIRDFEHVVDDLHHVAATASAAAPRKPLVLVGHSMGGMIATRFAQRHADEIVGLVLSGPAVGHLRMAEQLLALAEIPDVPIDPGVLSRDPAVGAAYASDPLVYHGALKRPTLEALRTTQQVIEAGPRFGALPTLWLHGDDDQLVPLADARQGLTKLRGSDFTERIYAGARHEAFNEINHAEVLDEVVKFISRVTRQAA